MKASEQYFHMVLCFNSLQNENIGIFSLIFRLGTLAESERGEALNMLSLQVAYSSASNRSHPTKFSF